jgi:glycosyltransferase involved in cell wall biosynthesis
MKLSFVIPAHNEEYYIGDCLKAILAQKEGAPCEVEVIVVDNASTDRTAEIAEGFAGVKVVRESQKGIIFARHAGLLAATGDLIANVDADTRITPHWILKVAAAFKKDPKLVGLSGPFILFDAPWNVRLLAWIFNGIGYVFYLIIRFVLHAGSLLQGGNFVIRRDALEKIGGYDTSIEFYGEDTDVARRLSKIGKVRFTPNLPTNSSARRLAKEGVFRMGVRYATNIIWITFFKHPYTKGYIDVRPDRDGAAPKKN